MIYAPTTRDEVRMSQLTKDLINLKNRRKGNILKTSEISDGASDLSDGLYNLHSFLTSLAYSRQK